PKPNANCGASTGGCSPEQPSSSADYPSRVLSPKKSRRRRTARRTAKRSEVLSLVSSRSQRLRYPPEILKTVDAGAVSVRPARLDRVTANDFETSKFKAVVGITDPARAGHNVAEHVR